jgi:hypothetical protein
MHLSRVQAREKGPWEPQSPDGRGLSWRTGVRVRGRFQKLIVYWLLAVGLVLAFPAHSRVSDLQSRYFLVVWGYQGAGNC